MGQHPSKTVSFRFQREEVQALAERADTEGLSPGEFVRRVVRKYLGADGQEAELLEKVSELDEGVAALRDDVNALREGVAAQLRERPAWFAEALTLTTALLLADAGKGESVEAGLLIVQRLLGLEETE